MCTTNISVVSLILQQDNFCRCNLQVQPSHLSVILSGLRRASLSGFHRKEFAKTSDEKWRDWFQQNHYEQPWEQEIITALTSFDHRYSYSQNVGADRTMRWRAQNLGEFALVFPFFPPLMFRLWIEALSRTWRDKNYKMRIVDVAWLSCP